MENGFRGGSHKLESHSHFIGIYNFNLIFLGYINGLKLFTIRSSPFQSLSNTILNVKGPSMDGELLAVGPGILDNGGVAHVLGRVDGVELNQATETSSSILVAFQLSLMKSVDILDVSQPIIDQTKLFMTLSGSYTTTVVMT